MPTRRGLLASLASTALAPSLSWACVGSPLAVSAAQLPDGNHVLVGLDAEGAVTFRVPLPARGHAAAAHPHFAEAVAFARRPGTFAKVVDCATGHVNQTLIAPEGRHFYGHGCFSSDGTLLFTTENDYATGAGRIGVWDRSLGYRRIDEFPSGGVGPHEILRRPNGTLAVANGGIRTHPDTGRQKLNLATMQPNLTVFSTAGAMLDQAMVNPGMHLNSLRHIAVQSDGTVACGFQWQGDPFEAPPLIAFYRDDGLLHPADMDEALLRRLDGYIGSVSAHGTRGFAASSPRGGRVFTLDGNGQVTGVQAAVDVCGVAQCVKGPALVTDGTGRVARLGKLAFTPLASHDLAFDNHLVAVLS